MPSSMKGCLPASLTTSIEMSLELAHESLLTQWHQLAQWIDDDRKFLDWHTKVRDRVDGMLPESEVAEAREWLARRRPDIDVSVQEMIERSRTYYEEQVRRLKSRERKPRRLRACRRHSALHFCPNMWGRCEARHHLLQSPWLSSRF